jgi:hypothetical protein
MEVARNGGSGVRNNKAPAGAVGALLFLTPISTPCAQESSKRERIITRTSGVLQSLHAMKIDHFHGQLVTAADSTPWHDNAVRATQPLRKPCVLRSGVEVIPIKHLHRAAPRQLYPPLT